MGLSSLRFWMGLCCDSGRKDLCLGFKKLPSCFGYKHNSCLLRGRDYMALGRDYQVVVENSLSPAHTLIHITCQDHKGLLYDIMRTFKDFNIQDKWRNLLKASYDDKHNNGEAEERRKSVARPIPKDILHRVNELASLHPYPFSKSLCFVHDSSRSQSNSKKKKRRR